MRKIAYLLICLVLISCFTENPGTFPYTVESDIGLQHYKQGWEQIMDEGRYGEAEKSYRKTLKLAPDFLIGKSVLARLTPDLDERLKLYREINENKDQIMGDERRLLDVYLALVHYTNLRDQQSDLSKNALQGALETGEANLRTIVYKYPKEVFLKAEYLEILHSLYGSKVALDSLKKLTTASQKKNSFLLGFAASMEAELKMNTSALRKAAELRAIINNDSLPKSHAVYADLYYQMDSLQKAKAFADKATALDPRNLDARRLKKKIDKALGERE